MKTTKFVALGLVSLTVLGLGSTIANAAGPEKLPATSYGKVQLINDWTGEEGGEDGGGVVDPEKEKPETIHPEIKPPIAGDKDLALMYYPDFDFGFQSYNEDKVNTFQASVLNYGTTTANKTTDQVVPFIQVRSAVTGWTLTARASEFQEGTYDDATRTFKAKDGGKTLAGAQIKLSNMSIVNNTKDDDDNFTGKTADLPATTYDLSTGTNNLATLTGGNEAKIAKNSILFGDTMSDSTDTAGTKATRKVMNGVTLTIPAGLSISDQAETYVSTITWTLKNAE